MSDDRRLEPRYALSVPMRIGDVVATTTDLSLAGVAFVSPVPFPPNSTITFSIVLRASGMPVQMDCTGTITRTDPAGPAFRVAATIDRFRIATENTTTAQPARVPTP